MKTAVMFSKASDEWSTPQDFFDVLNAEFAFQIDAAATAANTKCGLWWEEALHASTWTIGPNNRIWLNPPYSRCREFIAKAAEEARKGCTVVCLVPSRTCTRWWHEHVWDASTHAYRRGVSVRFIKGRLKFGGSTNSAPFPSVVIVFHPIPRCASRRCGRTLDKGKYCDRYCLAHAKTDRQCARVREKRELRKAATEIAEGGRARRDPAALPPPAPSTLAMSEVKP